MDQRLTPDELAQAHQDLFGTPCAMTQCAQCEEFVPLHMAVVTTYQITEHVQEQEHFCSDGCAIAHWRALHPVTE